MPSPYLVELFAPVYKLSLWFTCAVSVNVWSLEFLAFSPMFACGCYSVILTMFCYNQWCSYLHHVYTLLQWEDIRAFSHEWILTHSTQWPITGVQEINRCDWLHCSKLQKHVVNGNLWHILEHRLKDVLEPLPNLFRQYPIIAVFTDGAIDCVRKWTCDVRAWEQSQLRELATLPIYTVIPSKVYNSVGGVLPHFIGRHSSRNSGNQRERKRGMGRQHDQVPSKV